jgi:hypothetical protein
MICSNTVDWKEAVLRSFKSFVWYPSCIDVKQKEDELTDRLIKQLRWTAVDCTLRGMFGWKEFKTDKKVTHINNKCLNTHFVLEVKKVAIPNTEYGLLARRDSDFALSLLHLLTIHLQQNLEIYLFYVSLVDWGRASYRFLCYCEIDFLCKYLQR